MLPRRRRHPPGARRRRRRAAPARGRAPAGLAARRPPSQPKPRRAKVARLHARSSSRQQTLLTPQSPRDAVPRRRATPRHGVAARRPSNPNLAPPPTLALDPERTSKGALRTPWGSPSGTHTPQRQEHRTRCQKIARARARVGERRVSFVARARALACEMTSRPLWLLCSHTVAARTWPRPIKTKAMATRVVRMHAEHTQQIKKNARVKRVIRMHAEHTQHIKKNSIVKRVVKTYADPKTGGLAR